MANKLPDQSFLVDKFKLGPKGRENGSINMPPASEPGLDQVEAEVEGYCHSIYKDRLLEDYRKEQDLLAGRMKLERPEEDADGMAEESCEDMQNMVRTAKPDLEGHRDRVEESRKARRKVMEKYGLDNSQAPKMPESWVKFGGILAALIVVETIINGIFFGANLRGGLLGGMTYAAIISVVNVVALGSAAGLLVAWLFGPAARNNDTRPLPGVLCLGLVVVLAVLLNLGVAHYREALPVDYPPAPDSVGNVATLAEPTQDGAESDVARCWRGDDEMVAGREAICLFWNHWFVLNDFQSYLLMLIGLAMFVGGAWKWWGKQDPYPGYGQAAHECQSAEDDLARYQGDLLEELDRRRAKAVQQQERHARLADPVAHYDRASEAYDESCKHHAKLCDDAEYLQQTCWSAIKSYRSANRAHRTDPEPESWQNDWTADWKLPDAPAKPDIASRSDAQRRADEAKVAKEARVKKVSDCCRECGNEVRRTAHTEVVSR